MSKRSESGSETATSGNKSDNHDDDEATHEQSTRRSVLALAGVSGLGALISGEPAANNTSSNTVSSSNSVSLNGDLDLQGNDVENVGEISMAAENGTLTSPEEESLNVEGGANIDELSVTGWHVVDVSEHGIRPGTEDDLGAFIDQHFNRQEPDESVIYYLPEGTYTWNTAVQSEEFNAFGIVGKPQAEVTCTNPEMEYFLLFGSSRAEINDIFIAENVTFNIETPDAAASSIIAAVDDFIYINNCEIVGRMDRNYGYVYSIHPTLLTNTGRGYVNVVMTDGSFYDPSLREQDHPMGISLEHDHRGYLVIENSYIEGFMNNGIYSSGHNGNVAIRNTTIKNCGAGLLRLGNGDYAYKCHLINDDAEDRGYSYAALWVKNANTAVADSIKIDAEQRTPSELVRVNADVQNCTLSNIDINSSANQYVCDFTGSGSDAGAVIATNWNIHDTGGGDSRLHVGVIRRANTKIENWDVDLDPPDGASRKGLLIDAPWVNVTGCTFQHRDGAEQMVILDDDADYLRLKDCDFKSGTLFQFSRATVEDAIVADNRFMDGTDLHGEQVNWTTR